MLGWQMLTSWRDFVGSIHVGSGGLGLGGLYKSFQEGSQTTLQDGVLLGFGWSYMACKWPYKWVVSGLISPYLLPLEAPKMYPNAAPIKHHENSLQKLYKLVEGFNPQKYGWNNPPKNEGRETWVVAMFRIF